MSATTANAFVAPGELPMAAKVFAFASMCVGFFIALLDIQIVSASLADIGGGLSAGTDEVAWVQTSYLIAEIVVIPLSGWLSRVMSTCWLFCASAVGFTITSLLCGWAWNIESMIVFRAMQGFLGGSMIPTVFTTAFIYFNYQQRVIAAATIGCISSLAPTLGPTIGGWITDNYSWHWLFFINLIPGVFVSIVVPMLVRVDRPNLSLLRGADYPGMGADGAVPGVCGIHAGGGASLGLVRRRHDPRDRVDLRHRRHGVHLAQSHLQPARGRSPRAEQPQLLTRLLVLVRDHRARVPQGVGDGVLCGISRRTRGRATDAAARSRCDLLHRCDGEPARRRRVRGVRRGQGYRQPRDAWTFEMDIRPFGEKW